VADKLEINSGDPVVILESSTALDGFPLSVRTAFMIGSVFGRLTGDHDINLDRSPYDVITDVLGEAPGVTELFISSSTADRIVAGSLGVQEGAALLDTTRVIRDRSGRALEHSISHARGDRLIMRTLMRASGGSDRTGSPADALLRLRLA
jgi:GntR family transcriptional regulator